MVKRSAAMFQCRRTKKPEKEGSPFPRALLEDNGVVTKLESVTRPARRGISGRSTEIGYGGEELRTDRLEATLTEP